MKALMIIDMQMGMDIRIRQGRDCVNPDASRQVADLAAAFRDRGLPVIHIRHSDPDPASLFHQDSAGFPPTPGTAERPDEPVFLKRTSSAFASTNLAEHLRSHGIGELLVAGAVAGFCVSSTVRAGADLGFDMTVAQDAVLGFGLRDYGLSARTIFDVTMALLGADYARITNTAAVLARPA